MEGFEGFHCAICLEECVDVYDSFTGLCNHRFHKMCIAKWLTSDEPHHCDCPICRIDLCPEDIPEIGIPDVEVVLGEGDRFVMVNRRIPMSMPVSIPGPTRSIPVFAILAVVIVYLMLFDVP